MTILFFFNSVASTEEKPAQLVKSVEKRRTTKKTSPAARAGKAINACEEMALIAREKLKLKKKYYSQKIAVQRRMTRALEEIAKSLKRSRS